MIDGDALNEQLRADWDVVREWRQSGRHGPDPQDAMAPKYFGIYLASRPSPAATKALDHALAMWGNQRGGSAKIVEAMEQVGHSEGVWPSVLSNAERAYGNDGRHEAYRGFLRCLLKRAAAGRCSSAIESNLGELSLQDGCWDDARDWFGRAVSHEDVPEAERRDAAGYLYEATCLRPGQPAPHFEADDLTGGRVSLAHFAGRILVLHFWGSTCGPCEMVYPHLRAIAERFVGSVALVGVSEDPERGRAAVCAEREGLVWPIVCDGLGFGGPVFRLYNVTGIPKIYVIDAECCIVDVMMGANGAEARLVAAVHEAVG